MTARGDLSRWQLRWYAWMEHTWLRRALLLTIGIPAYAGVAVFRGLREAFTEWRDDW